MPPCCVVRQKSRERQAIGSRPGLRGRIIQENAKKASFRLRGGTLSSQFNGGRRFCQRNMSIGIRLISIEEAGNDLFSLERPGGGCENRFRKSNRSGILHETE
jgi:hypothetical protein